eukprot:13792843-Heterocapsa_arctica.AAC.1
MPQCRGRERWSQVVYPARGLGLLPGASRSAWATVRREAVGTWPSSSPHTRGRSRDQGLAWGARPPVTQVGEDVPGEHVRGLKRGGQTRRHRIQRSLRDRLLRCGGLTRRHRILWRR